MKNMCTYSEKKKRKKYPFLWGSGLKGVQLFAGSLRVAVGEYTMRVCIFKEYK